MESYLRTLINRFLLNAKRESYRFNKNIILNMPQKLIQMSNQLRKITH